MIWIHHNLFNKSPINGYFGCFQFFTIMIKATTIKYTRFVQFWLLPAIKEQLRIWWYQSHSYNPDNLFGKELLFASILLSNHFTLLPAQPGLQGHPLSILYFFEMYLTHCVISQPLGSIWTFAFPLPGPLGTSKSNRIFRWLIPLSLFIIATSVRFLVFFRNPLIHFFLGGPGFMFCFLQALCWTFNTL